MKPELTLPERPSVLYLLAVFDVLAVLLIFFTLIPEVAQQAGFVVEPARTTFRLPTMDGRISLTARPGPRPAIALGMKRVSMENLGEELERAKASGVEEVIFIPDRGLTWEFIIAIREAILEADLRVAEAGRFPVEDPSEGELIK